MTGVRVNQIESPFCFSAMKPIEQGLPGFAMTFQFSAARNAEKAEEVAFDVEDLFSRGRTGAG
jgi:hypothetical protein